MTRLSLLFLSVLCICSCNGNSNIWQNVKRLTDNHPDGVLCLFLFVFVFYIYSRYQRSQHQRFKKLITGKEKEMKECQTHIQHLKRQVKEHAEEIVSAKNSYKTLKLKYEGLLRYKSLASGMKLYNIILNDPDASKGILSSMEAVNDFVCYYSHIHEDSLRRLKKAAFGLTNYEAAICILFIMKLSHRQVAEILNSTPETLSKIKLRTKNDRFRAKNDVRKLEEIIASLF